MLQMFTYRVCLAYFGNYTLRISRDFGIVPVPRIDF